MPTTTSAAPAHPPQQYFEYAPTALVLSQESKLHRASAEPVRRKTLASERTAWHKTRHHYETHTEPATADETAFRHSGWGLIRKEIRAAFIRCNLPAMRLDRFDQCGSGCRVQRQVETNRFRLSANYCHDRFCLPCARARSRRIGENLAKLCGDRPASHIVLTIQHSTEPLAAQLDKLIRCFAALRRLKFWKDRVTGGAYFFECKVARCGKLWHPHLHVVVNASYMDVRELSASWLAVTGDSHYVHIKRIDKDAKILRYAAKYASKSYETSIVYSRGHLDECLLALRGRRVCSTFGEWRGTELEDEPQDSGTWIDLGRLDSIIRDARGGSVGSIGLLYMVAPRYAEKCFPLGRPLEPPGAAPASGGACTRGSTEPRSA